MLDLPYFGSLEEQKPYKFDDLLKAIRSLEGRLGSADLPDTQASDELCSFIENEESDAVRSRLIEEPLLVQTPNSSGRLPLHEASRQGKSDIVELLMDFGSSVNAVDAVGKSALDYANEGHASEMLQEALRRRGGDRRAQRGSEDDLAGSGLSVGGSSHAGSGAASFASCQWNDFGLTSHLRDADMSEPVEFEPPPRVMSTGLLDTSVTEEGEIDEVITLPPAVLTESPEPVSFVDPNSRNTLVFRCEEGVLFYDVKGVRRPSVKKIEFCPAPPRLMFPDIGTCATLPDTNIAHILAGIRTLAQCASIPHDIPSVIQKRRETIHWNSDKSNLVIVMMGLPGRGKTFIAQRLCRWLNWKGVRARIFGSERENDTDIVQSMVNFLEDTPGAVGVLGATQCLVDDRRRLIQQVAPVASQERVLFIDAASNDRDLIKANVLGGGDVPPEEEERLMREHEEREKRQLRRHHPLSEHIDGDLSWVQISTTMNHNTGTKVSINKVTGHLCQKLLFFLFNLHPVNTPTYLVRTGECLHQVANRVGGDSELTSKGWQHAAAVRRFFNLPNHKHKRMQVFGSTMKRAEQTQSCFSGKRFLNVQYKTLNEINAAECDGLTPEEIKQKFPLLWSKRARDKYFYGWPRGESYSNMNQRLEQVILDLHRSTLPVLIIGHLDVCRGLYAYLSEMLPELCVYLTLPQHCIYEFNYNTTKHALSITVHDIGELIQDAQQQEVSSCNRPAPEYFQSVPAKPPRRIEPPQLPAHVKDIMSAGGTGAVHQRSLSGTFLDALCSPTTVPKRPPPPPEETEQAPAAEDCDN